MRPLRRRVVVRRPCFRRRRADKARRAHVVVSSDGQGDVSSKQTDDDDDDDACFRSRRVDKAIRAGFVGTLAGREDAGAGGKSDDSGFRSRREDKARQARPGGTPDGPRDRRHLVVDGMNAVGFLYCDLGKGGADWHRRMYSGYPRRLLGALQACQSMYPELERVTVVFDSPRLGNAAQIRAWAQVAKRTWSFGGMRVCFVPPEARGQLDGGDWTIRSMLAAWSEPMPPLVVSNDRAVQGYASEFGFEYQRCIWLADRLRRDTKLVKHHEVNIRLPGKLRDCFAVY